MQPTVAEAIALQEELRLIVDTTDRDSGVPRYVAGLDVAYDGDEYVAAVVVLARVESLPGPDGPGADSPGADRPGADRPGADRPGAENPGAENPGADVPGADGPGTNRPGADGPGANVSGYDGPEMKRADGGLAAGLREVDRAVVRGRTSFPYVPGLFAFREVPGLVAALERLRVTPDLLVCDGQGLAHPRRFGLACHLGVVTGLPSIGVGKTAFVGDWEEPGPERGAASDLVLEGEVVGKVPRTQNKTKPVFVSVGHLVSLGTAVERVLELAPRFRLPETTRMADRACRDGLAG
ncbi:endonuclease V [Kribbella sp. DT2]|uniref:endonuclease V n=1 Tax=Kribbella sp. DT2 TaxID=3393427 RepID=UPI003CF8650E